MDKDYIMNFLNDRKKYTRNMKSDVEIYEYICDVLYIKDFELARQCSIEHWRNLHGMR